MIKRLVSYIFFVFSAVACVFSDANAQKIPNTYEKITSYDVEIRLNQDSSAVVTEKISVIAAHRLIRRGIYRDLKRMKNSSYEVTGVTRNGQNEPFFVEKRGPLFRINTGNDDYIPRGKAVFTITYRVQNILTFFKDRDELYWNITGNHWSFPIESATARIIAPDGAVITERSSWQGATGSRDPARYSDGVFSSTETLYTGEGLTVAIGFEKGFFYAVEMPDKTKPFLFAAFAVLFAYMLITWLHVGRDPEKGAVMPRYDILPKISPAFEGYIAGYGTDPERLAAIAVLQGCVSKFLKIKQKDKKTFTVDKLRPPETKEEKIIDKVFSFPQEISETQRLKLNDLKDRLSMYFASRSEAYFETNSLWLAGAYGLFFCLTCVLFFSLADSIMEISTGEQICGLFFVFMMLSGASYQIQKRICAKRLSLQLPFYLFVLLLQSLAFLTVCPLPVIIFALSSTIALAVYGYLIKRPFPRGIKVLEHLDGIKMFLDAVNLYPETFDDMEKLLPFAVLLDMEKQYNRKTKALIEKFHMAPQWFYDMPHYSRFTTSYASYAAPVARSGTGGGGFSGGGGGGFGGGGR